MEPQKTWEELLSAYAEGKYDLLEQRATELIGLLDRGYCPRILKEFDVGSEWDAALARAGAQFALETVQGEWRVRT